MSLAEGFAEGAGKTLVLLVPRVITNQLLYQLSYAGFLAESLDTRGFAVGQGVCWSR